METLIELYDERPLENVLGVEMFRPERVVYVCPDRIASTIPFNISSGSIFCIAG